MRKPKNLGRQALNKRSGRPRLKACDAQNLGHNRPHAVIIALMRLDFLSAFTPAFRLDLAGNLWLAASPQMPPALLSTLRKAFQKQEDSGYLAKLIKSGRPVGG
ncbi:MAG: hypothetical protein ACK5A0_05570 [Polaromonas sp.]